MKRLKHVLVDAHGSC